MAHGDYGMTIRQRYDKGWKFFKVRVLRNGSGEWLAVGMFRPVLGDGYPTWREAFDAAFEGRR